ncbi:alpha/beta hydrolase [Nostoc sp. 'Peltigera membranacea cyanobiont' 210A]|uniref:alpha/beta fold hydrolase n=1 Tax=Nostoc sp. 'Peltigera membranacea cyanobiont' 210A TaxID=2014529 RepID=UPI000B956CF3|nr:alpha/beta hydrolase [Nostoc sp. 'Peltigera membranacea cyanobiont' 210A]OYD91529.1 alpha/beta hydrolase [Nostoc sp. 'Peltigera membranacea cyanobiont' 210A]
MPSKIHSHPYFLTPELSNSNYPLFVFLPGMDETGKELMYIQTAGLEAAFDVRCFVIPPDVLTSWDEMTEKVATLTKIELEKVPQSHVYLCGESFGGCLALKVLEKCPQLFTKIILINSASSFHRVPWLNLGSLLFPYTPQLFYKISSFLSLPFLANLSRISPTARLALSKSTSSAPQETANQRLSLMREFDVDENKLSQITQPVLLIASRDDRLLPSEAEAKHLNNIFPNSQTITLPHSGHACLVERDINLYKILLSANFIVA